MAASIAISGCTAPSADLVPVRSIRLIQGSGPFTLTLDVVDETGLVGGAKFVNEAPPDIPRDLVVWDRSDDPQALLATWTADACSKHAIIRLQPMNAAFRLLFGYESGDVCSEQLLVQFTVEMELDRPLPAERVESWDLRHHPPPPD